VAFETRFTLALPFGVCLGVALPEVDSGAPFALPGELHPGEAAFADPLPPIRRAAWAGGRVALRRALALAGFAAPAAILATPRGAPALPAGLVGSISHKHGHKQAIAVALVAAATDPPATVGIDVEEVRVLYPGVAERVLTDRERAALPAAGPARDAAVLLRFSAKEAIYKALDPWVGRFVEFEEAEIAAAPDGALAATLALEKGEGPFAVELHDARGAGQPGLILTAARVRR
jgi:enterobactin synthetase component D